MEQYLFKSTMNINEYVRITSMVIGHMFFLLTLNRRFPIQKWFKRENECYTLSPYSFEMYEKYIPESVRQIVQKSLHSSWMKIATTQQLV